jgi:hypothetical protein
MFRKKDSGIGIVAKKAFHHRNLFFDNHYEPVVVTIGDVSIGPLLLSG